MSDNIFYSIGNTVRERLISFKYISNYFKNESMYIYYNKEDDYTYIAYIENFFKKTVKFFKTRGFYNYLEMKDTLISISKEEGLDKMPELLYYLDK